MSRAGRHRAGAARTLDSQRAAMGVRPHLIGRVAEHVLGPAQPGPEVVKRRLEHMFDSLRSRSDGIPGHPRDGRKSHAADPSEDHTSSFVRTRSITVSVNSVVPACPPRSGVFTPEAIASSTAS